MSQLESLERPVPERVKADDGIDGARWHTVHAVDEDDYRAADVIVTDCGLEIAWTDADQILFEDDEKPHYSGNKICYGCIRWSQ